MDQRLEEDAYSKVKGPKKAEKIRILGLEMPNSTFDLKTTEGPGVKPDQRHPKLNRLHVKSLYFARGSKDFACQNPNFVCI
jgi:hypothetical protein